MRKPIESLAGHAAGLSYSQARWLAIQLFSAGLNALDALCMDEYTEQHNEQARHFVLGSLIVPLHILVACIAHQEH